MDATPRHLLALLLASFTVIAAPLAAHADRTVKVTPWFEYSESEPLIDIPHTAVSSPYRSKIRIKVGDEWKDILATESVTGPRRFYPQAFNMNRSVFMPSLRGAPASIYNEGVEKPVPLPGYCRDPALQIDAFSVICVWEDPKTKHVAVDLYESTGRIVRHSDVKLPGDLAGRVAHLHVEAWDIFGRPVVQADLDGYKGCTLILLRAPEARELERISASGGCTTVPKLTERARQKVMLDPAAVAPRIEGTWIQQPSVEGPPPRKGCETRVVIGSEGSMESSSGDMKVRSRIEVQRKPEGFILARRDPRVEGGADCWGSSAEEIRKRLVPMFAVEVEGDRLRMNLPFTPWQQEYRRAP